MSEQWMSIVEYARAYNISDMTVRRRIKTGKLEAVLREGKYFIPISSLNFESTPKQKQVSEIVRPQREAYPSDQHGAPSRSESPQVEPRYIETRPRNNEPHAVRPRPEHRFETNHNRNYSNEGRYEGQNNQTKPQHHKPNHNVRDVSRDIERMVRACQSSLQSFRDMEAKLEAQYQDKVAALEAKLATKDADIEKLRQKVEDLQLLVSILERRNA